MGLGQTASGEGKTVITLDSSAAGVMDEEGKKILKAVMDKEELDRDMQNEAKNLRSRTIRRTARTLALQKAVQWRYRSIGKMLRQNSLKLDRIFDFSPLLMKGNKVLPPVIAEAGPGYRVQSATQASSTDKVFRIVSPARMISGVPTWKDYLLRSYRSFGRKDVQAGVLPGDRKERKIWQRAAVEGWETGIKQAERLFGNNLSRLVRDYKGILKFRILAEQDMVSLPVIAEGRLGIQVQGKKLSVDRKIFRITRPSSFQKVEEWNPKVRIEN